MPRTAFLFPGQGAQTVGMARQLIDTVPAAKRLFTRASELLGYDLADVCVNGPAERLNATDVSQPAIFVASLAALEQLRETNPAGVDGCTATAGLSLGEYTALVFADVFSFEEGLKLVQRRGQAMQAAAEANPGSMVSVIGVEAAKVEELCAAARSAGPLVLANFLCPGNIVCSGAKAACDALEQLAADAGARTVRLAVAGAFHTPLMHPADQKLAAALGEVSFRSPRIPVFSNVDAQPHQNAEDFRTLLVRQLVEPVLFEQELRNLLAAGVEAFYEIGPGRVLAGLLKRVQRKTEVTNVQA